MCKILHTSSFSESPKIELVCKILHTKALFGGALPQPQCTPQQSQVTFAPSRRTTRHRCTTCSRRTGRNWRAMAHWPSASRWSENWWFSTNLIKLQRLCQGLTMTIRVFSGQLFVTYAAWGVNISSRKILKFLPYWRSFITICLKTLKLRNLLTTWEFFIPFWLDWTVFWALSVPYLPFPVTPSVLEPRYLSNPNPKLAKNGRTDP